jgi:hypothetical protein
MTTAQATEVARLKQKLEVAEDDLTLINRRLDEAQGMLFEAVSICKYDNMSMTLKIVY